MFFDGPALRAHRVLAIGRHLGRRGWDRGGGGFWGAGGGGGGGLPLGRKISSDDLQVVLLALLDERPAHGYELIRAIEAGSGGFYTPSPGVIYPALTFLGDIGHATVAQDANRKLYSITDAGRAHLQANRDRADAILDALGRIGGRMQEVREAFAGVNEADPRAADALHRARHALKHALMRKRGCGAEEARRITQILERATAEILKTKEAPRG
jgi:DNA-binding PadR family transcriptional regulator